MEDTAIKPLEDAAYDYVEVRDKRQALTAREVPAKAKVLQLMKQFGKEHYERDGIEIDFVHEKETVKVKVKKESDAKKSKKRAKVEAEEPDGGEGMDESIGEATE